MNNWEKDMGAAANMFQKKSAYEPAFDKFEHQKISTFRPSQTNNLDIKQYTSELTERTNETILVRNLALEYTATNSVVMKDP